MGRPRLLMKLKLRNPHSIAAVLLKRPSHVRTLQLPEHSSGAWAEVERLAARAGTMVTRKGRGEEAGATIQAMEEADLDRVMSDPSGESSGADEPAIRLAVDHVQDPHNLGAIFRSAAFFGVRGILLPRDRTSPITSVVYDVASGGLEEVPFTRVTNLGRALDDAKESGHWILGTSENADTDLEDVPRDRSWVVVVGNEERGMRRLTEQKCDVVCRIRSLGGVHSLNASVAAGVLLACLTSRKQS